MDRCRNIKLFADWLFPRADLLLPSLVSELTLWQPPVAPAKKGKTDRVRLSTRNLTAPEKIEIENRGLAGQRPTSIAREMGVTFGQVTSYLRRAMVARFRATHDIELVEYYDPAVADANIRRLRLARTDIVVAEKRFGSFWAKRGSGEKWPEWFKKTKAFIDAAMVC